MKNRIFFARKSIKKYVGSKVEYGRGFEKKVYFCAAFFVSNNKVKINHIMKKLFFLLGVFAIMGMSFAQTIDIRQNTYQKVSISFTPGALSVEEITVPEGVFSLVSMPSMGNPTIRVTRNCPSFPNCSRFRSVTRWWPR